MSRIGILSRRANAVLPGLWPRAVRRPLALSFHGVLAQADESGLVPGACPAEAFFEILLSLKREFDILHLSFLEEALAFPHRHRRSLFLTADGGFANMATRAAPILAELCLPWALFVSTQHIGSDEADPAFTIRAFCRLMPEGIYEFPNLPPFELGTAMPRAKIALLLTQALTQADAETAHEAAAAMQARLGSHGLELLSEYPEERFLDWDTLEVLAARGVMIGAEGHWHWPLNAAQPLSTLREQVETPLRQLQSRLGSCAGFAYPFGGTSDIAPAAWQAVRDAGYSYGFTAVDGTLDAAPNRYLLPRYRLDAVRSFEAVLPTLRLANARFRQFAVALDAAPRQTGGAVS